MNSERDRAELNLELQKHGVKVLNLYTRQEDRYPAYVEGKRLFITNAEGRILDEVCEVNIVGSVSEQLRRQTALVRRLDLKRDPCLYRWFKSLENGTGYFFVASGDNRWSSADPYTTIQLKQAGLI